MPFFDYEGNPINASSIFVDVVNDFGAKADGTTDDSTAIQNALDSLKDTGGIIFFPKGTYKVGTSLVYYSHQTLWFENGSSLVEGSSSLDNFFRCYCNSLITRYSGTHDVRIHGAFFNINSDASAPACIAMAHAKDIIIEKCKFNNGVAGHDLEINSSYNVKVIGCDHSGSRKNYAQGELIQIDIPSSSTYPWDDVNADGTVCKYIEIYECVFHDNSSSPAIGNHNGSHEFVSIHDNVFDNITSSRGAIDFTSGTTNVDIFDNTFNGCTTGVGSSGATYYIHDNRFVSATTAISGSTSVVHANMINGTYTA